MKLAERHIIKRGHTFWHQIDRLSWDAKNLYNAANCLIRQNFIYGQGYLSYKWIASLDLGVDVLMAVTSNQPGFVPLLINGRPLKSLNQFYNKRLAFLQSQAPITY